MSSYPPTPAFGRFSFVPPKAAEPHKAAPSDVPPASHPVDATTRRTSIPSQVQSPTAPLPPTRDPPAKMSTKHSYESSDSMEEGELSEPHSTGRNASSSPSAGEGRWIRSGPAPEVSSTTTPRCLPMNPEHRPDQSPVYEPSSNWYILHHMNPCSPAISRSSQ